MRGVNVNGERIRELRVTKGLTQELLAAAACCDVKTIRKAEQSGRLDARVVVAIANSLTCSLNELTSAGDKDLAIRRKEIILQWNDFFYRREVEEIMRFHTEDAVWEIPGSEGLPAGSRGHDYPTR